MLEEGQQRGGEGKLAVDERGRARAVGGRGWGEDGEGGDEVGRGGPVGRGGGRRGEVEVEEEGGGDFGSAGAHGIGQVFLGEDGRERETYVSERRLIAHWYPTSFEFTMPLSSSSIPRAMRERFKVEMVPLGL